MTKIDIFSGFLGAGKTTLIRKLIAEGYQGEKLVLIENEFGEIAIDGGFLQDAGVQITEMNSGCICCTLVGDFTKALKKVMEDYAPDRIIIEPSGVGKLSDVSAAVSRVEGAEIGAKVTVVDAAKCKMYMRNFGEFFNDQVACANLIVMSRTDIASEAKVAEAIELLRTINPTVSLITTPLTKIGGEQIREAMEHNSLKEEMEHMEHEHHHHHDHDEEECDDPDCCCHHHHDDDDEDEHEHHHHHHHDDDEECDDPDCCCHHHHDDDDDEDEHEHHHHHHHDDDDEDEHEHHHHHDDDEDEHEHHHHHHHDDDEECDDPDCCCHHHHDDDDDEDEHEHHHHHHHHHHADEIFTSWGVETAKKFSEEELKAILTALEDEEKYGIILRAKGIVDASDGEWIYFDYTPGESDIRRGNAAVTGRFCVIGSKIKEAALKELFKVG